VKKSQLLAENSRFRAVLDLLFYFIDQVSTIMLIWNMLLGFNFDVKRNINELLATLERLQDPNFNGNMLQSALLPHPHV
jgi:hypothetical protein